VEHFQAEMGRASSALFGPRAALPGLVELIEKTGRSVCRQGFQTMLLLELNRESRLIAHGLRLLRLPLHRTSPFRI
jgi:hypothetical protein